MTDLSLKRLLLGSTLMVSFSATAAFAQSTNVDPLPETDEQVADGITEQVTPNDAEDEFLRDDSLGGEIVVTGSRLKRDTFSSITPLEVIDTDFAATQGLFNPVEILQSSASAAGQQIDSTFGGFVLDNGPGSETVDLRGLGASRTLVTVDGRRAAPSGVEGAPSQVSVNAIPITFVDDFELLLDGASSVYGSDAVAGVANIILKRDFDGLEIDASTTLPEQGGGEGYTIGASYGVNGDRGFIGFQAEYDFRDNFTTGDRDFLAGCETYVEQTVDGEIRTGDAEENAIAQLAGLSAPVLDCRPTRLTQRFIADGFGSIYYQPDIGNTGIAGFSESALFGVPLDFNGDGVRDVNFADFSPNGQQQEIRDIFNQQELMSGRVVAEYTFEGAANITPYMDLIYTDLAVDTTGNQPQLFPFVPANNPFNPCNIDSPNGTDCNAAYNNVLLSPEYQAAFQNYYNNDGVLGLGSANCFGLGDTPACSPVTFGLLRPTGTSQQVRPVVGVRGDRNVTDVDIRQSRIVGGVRGDIPGLNFGSVGNVSFDISGVYSYSDSDSIRSGIRGDRLDLALGFDPVTGAVLDAPCQGANNLPLNVGSGCVPVNLFAPSLYSTAAAGDFATQAERDYLFDDRDFSTTYEQLTLDAFVSGSLFTLPGGDVQLGLGVQYREDDIDSQPDDVARDGLFFGFFSDAGASGDVSKKEAYGEILIPLGTGAVGFREFTVEAAGRLTDDEFYGTNETYSVKAGWRPVDSLLLRGTYGTSYRAPTVRELFLAGQTGFNTLFDPCAAPDAGIDGAPINDNRDPNLLAQCVADGLDPSTFSPGNSFFSTEISSGGVQAGEANLTLDPEESTSLTVGASFDQPFTDAFDLELGFTYYEYDIENTFSELQAGNIIASCYDARPGVNPACAFITRDFSDAATPGRFDVIFESFINQDEETAKGVDFNVDFGIDDVNVFGQNADFFVLADVNRQHERIFRDIQEDPETGELLVEEDNVAGNFAFAKWRGRITGGTVIDKFGFNWTAQYIGGVEVDAEDLGVSENDGFGNFVDNPGVILTSGGAAFGDVDARRVSFADDYWRHSASLSYAYDEDISMLIGVNNVFDRDPPLVDPREVFSISNVPIGSGYDINGRSFFLRLNTRF